MIVLSFLKTDAIFSFPFYMDAKNPFAETTAAEISVAIVRVVCQELCVSDMQTGFS